VSCFACFACTRQRKGEDYRVDCPESASFFVNCLAGNGLGIRPAVLSTQVPHKAFPTNPTCAWEKDDRLKDVKKISLRLRLKAACFAAGISQVFRRESHFRQDIFYFAGSIKSGE
jgi:hypothetical protein